MCLDRCYSTYISLRSRGVCSNSYSEMWLHTMEWWVSHSVLTVSRHLTLNSVDKEVYLRGRTFIVSPAITVFTNWVSGQCKYTFNISCVIQLRMMQKMSENTWNNTMCTCKHKRSFSTLNRKENFIPSLYIESFIFAAEAELDLISSCDPTQYLTWYFSVKAIRLLDIEKPDCSTLSTMEDKYKLSQTQLKLYSK